MSRASHLPTFTCATFFRRSLIDKHQLYFDTRWRDVGDADWVLRLLGLKTPTGILRYYTSAFTRTGENMNFKPNALREKKELHDSAPAWMRWGQPVIVLQHRLRKLSTGAYSQKPFQYAIYTKSNSKARTTVDVKRPAFLLG